MNSQLLRSPPRRFAQTAVMLAVHTMLLTPPTTCAAAESHGLNGRETLSDRIADDVMGEARREAFSDIADRYNDFADRIGVPHMDHPAMDRSTREPGFGIARDFTEWASRPLIEARAIAASFSDPTTSLIGEMAFEKSLYCATTTYGPAFGVCLGAAVACDAAVGPVCVSTGILCAGQLSTTQQKYSDCIMSP